MVSFQFTHPYYLLVLAVAIPWVFWLTWTSDVAVAPWRRWTAFAIRLVVLVAVVMALAGLQWLKPAEGMNIFYLLDRSESVPSDQKEEALEYVERTAGTKKKRDEAGVIVFGDGARLESTMQSAVEVAKIHSVVPASATDIAGAIRLATAAFPEHGQRRIVLLSDGNENKGDAMTALASARPLDISLDAVPLGVQRTNDVVVKALDVPSQLRRGQTFESKIIVEADRAQRASVQLFQNDDLLGQQEVELQAGKNLLSFPQTLQEPGFYSYEVRVNAPGDEVARNNRASAYASVEGDPRLLVISSQLEQDGRLVEALRSIEPLRVTARGLAGFPGTLAELQHYDTIFLSNVSAGDLSRDAMKLVESAVRDFGVGLVCIGGDKAFGAGSYGGTPLEEALPVEMELDSRKVLPKGALVLIMHGMEFNQGNQISRDVALGTLEAMSPQDELGLLLWDGSERWLFDLAPVGDKQRMARLIAGMNQGDMPSFQNTMEMALKALQKSTANLKHIIIFSDGDPEPPDDKLLKNITAANITISTVMIGGHVQPKPMMDIAEKGGGRFYNVSSTNQLPQIFLKETSVVLKSAISEEPFRPRQVSFSEMLRGLGDYPQLGGYVATTPKSRAEIPLVSDDGSPVLGHWQYGLGRAVAFTSDAKPKWAGEWIEWERFEQFWRQVAQWSLRKLESSNFNSDVTIEEGQGEIRVEAIDADGNYLNFLNLQASVVGPEGERQMVQLEQTGTGHYEGEFSASEVGAYQVNVMDIADGKVQSSQSLGANVNYSPELNATEPNRHLLNRLAGAGGGKVLSLSPGSESPFLHGRERTFQPRPLWAWLLQLAVLLFPFDVGVRRIQLEREQWQMVWYYIKRYAFFRRRASPPARGEESLDTLLAKRDQVRSTLRHGAVGGTAHAESEGVGHAGSSLSGVASGRGRTTEERAEASEEARQEAESEEGRPTSRLLDAKRRAQRWKK